MSSITRRAVLRATVAAATTPIALQGFAQDVYPSHAVTVVVPSAPGGGLDIIARKLGQSLSEQWKSPVIVENKNGGIGTIGTSAVVRAKPDGHTLLMVNTPVIQVPWLMQLTYDPLKDLVPVARLTVSYTMLAVQKSFPANTLEELIALAKAAPGKYSYGSWGPGTSTHLYAHVLCTQAGIDMIHVPYNGAAPMLNALVAGQISAAFVDPGSTAAHLGSLKLLAVVGDNRMAQFPSVPTLKEKGLRSFDELGWTGVFAPSQTPPALVARISEDIVRAMKQPQLTASLVSMNVTPNAMGTAEFSELVRHDSMVWGRIIKDANITNK